MFILSRRLWLLSTPCWNLRYLLHFWKRSNANSSSQEGTGLPLRGHLPMHGGIFGYHSLGEGVCYRHPVGRNQGAAKCSTPHRTAPHNTCPGQNVKTTKVEKCCFEVTQTSYLKEMQFLRAVERKIHTIGLTQIQWYYLWNALTTNFIIDFKWYITYQYLLTWDPQWNATPTV